MNTSRPTPFTGPATQEPFHHSSRTMLSENLNPETGRREQVMTTSQLKLAWAAGELVIRARGARLVREVDANEQQQPRRRMRGAL